MNFLKRSIVALLVFFGLAISTNLDAQSTLWLDRYDAVDNLGAEYETLQANPNGYTNQEVAALMRAYWIMMTEIDNAEDTEQGFLNAETEVYAQQAIKDPNGDFDNDIAALRDHILELITIQ